MSAIVYQITSLTIVYSTVYSNADQRKHQSSASLAFVRGIHRGPVNSPHKGPVTRKMFPFDDVIMYWSKLSAWHARMHPAQCHFIESFYLHSYTVQPIMCACGRIHYGSMVISHRQIHRRTIKHHYAGLSNGLNYYVERSVGVSKCLVVIFWRQCVWDVIFSLLTLYIAVCCQLTPVPFDELDDIFVLILPPSSSP